MLTAEQSRAARGLLAWSQDDLAAAADVVRKTVVDFEGGRRVPHKSTLDALRAAMEAAGVEFIPENGAGAGVRLAKRRT